MKPEETNKIEGDSISESIIKPGMGLANTKFDFRPFSPPFSQLKGKVNNHVIDSKLEVINEVPMPNNIDVDCKDINLGPNQPINFHWKKNPYPSEERKLNPIKNNINDKRVKPSLDNDNLKLVYDPILKSYYDPET